ncbi:MAG: hypothetical protein CM1200mP20_06580 [Pseudomonadota bacterium]|nr:MAG: hypothetical protein CM1200mP20_06580 [Pseudomonadota bacterium]
MKTGSSSLTPSRWSTGDRSQRSLFRDTGTLPTLKTVPKKSKGEGVVGEQPILKPGEGFRYTSGAVIETPVGTMHGTYQMIAEDGREFDATIPRFVLSAPRTLH